MIAFLTRLFRFRPQGPAWSKANELQGRLSAGEPIVLLDVRQHDEFTSPPGHLPGAVNVPLAELADRTPKLALREQLVVVICKTDRRSARAAGNYWLPDLGMSSSSAGVRMIGISGPNHGKLSVLAETCLDHNEHSNRRSSYCRSSCHRRFAVRVSRSMRLCRLATWRMAIHALFRLECNQRAGTVVGVIGAGGIGAALSKCAAALLLRPDDGVYPDHLGNCCPTR